MDQRYFDQYPESEIDLHGLSREEALSSLRDFIVWAREHDLHYIRVVTGKGLGSFDKNPVVRNAVVAYLNMEGYHYEFAPMFSGGNGVVFVSLS